MKEACWNQAPKVPGRDPGRWRLDPAGTPVCKQLRGCLGCLCHEYDHIVPFSKGGNTTLDNCQILSTRVNRLKGNSADADVTQLRAWSCAHQFSESELDTVECAVYGDIKRDGRTCVCKSYFQLLNSSSQRGERGKSLPHCYE
jgi:hypothetical protein